MDEKDDDKAIAAYNELRNSALKNIDVLLAAWTPENSYGYKKEDLQDLRIEIDKEYDDATGMFVHELEGWCTHLTNVLAGTEKGVDKEKQRAEENYNSIRSMALESLDSILSEWTTENNYGYPKESLEILRGEIAKDVDDPDGMFLEEIKEWRNHLNDLDYGKIEGDQALYLLRNTLVQNAKENFQPESKEYANVCFGVMQRHTASELNQYSFKIQNDSITHNKDADSNLDDETQFKPK